MQGKRWRGQRAYEAGASVVHRCLVSPLSTPVMTPTLRQPRFPARPSRTPRLCAGALVACALALCCLGAFTAAAAHAASRPNVVLIQTDDQTFQELYAKLNDGKPAMPNTLRRIANRGVTFRNYYTSYPLCCPSRTTLLTGTYAHNHGVLVNYLPNFGYQAFKRGWAFEENLAPWLQRAGYETIHVGKFLNQYGIIPGEETTQPPGWDQWETVVADSSPNLYYGYSMNLNGTVVGPFGSYEQPDSPDCGTGSGPSCNYRTEVEMNLATEQIASAASTGEPFYLQLDVSAPHVDAAGPPGPTPEPRDQGLASRMHYHPAAYNERELGDKPRFLRSDRLGRRQLGVIQTAYRNEVETLHGADRAIGEILDQLQRSGVDQNTYVIFLSDNGYFHGEHRIASGKYLPYEPSARVPFVISGPDIHRGIASAAVSNVDVAPTILELAGAAAGHPVDGSSLLPYVRDNSRRSRVPIALEGFTGKPGEGIERISPHGAPVTDYYGIVGDGFKMIRYWNGERELYDLRHDRGEEQNLIADPRYSGVRRVLGRRMRGLRTCAGRACRVPLPRRLPHPAWRRGER